MKGRFTRTLLGAFFVISGMLFTDFAKAQCGLQNPPVEESFDNTTMPPGCWTENMVAGSGWETGQQGDAGFGADPAGDHTGNGGYFAWVDFSGGDDTTYLVSPKVDVSGMTNPPELVYWFFSNNTSSPGDNNTLTIEAWDGTDWQTVKSHQQDSADWVRDSADLSAYIFNDTVQVRIGALENTAITGYQNDLLLDDINIRELPTCYEPLALNANALNADSIALDWQGAGTEWQVEYGAAGFTQGNGDSTIITNNPDTITGFSSDPGLSYDFYIRRICGAGDTSEWSWPVNVVTPCPTTFSTPHTENFDGSLWDPGTGDISPCWDRNPDNTIDYSWRTNTGTTVSGGTGPDGDHPNGTGNYVYTEGSDGGGTETASITTPWFDLTPLNLPELNFHYHFHGDDIDTFTVQIDSGNGFEGIDTIFGEQHADHATPWTERIKYLPDYANDTIRVRFTGRRGGSFDSDYAIDDFKLIEAPSCPTPTGLTANALNSDSVELSWNSFGSAIEWEVEYGPAGFGQGNGDTVTLGSNPDTINGLSSFNTLSFDFYLRQVCGAGDTSNWTGPVNVVTPCPSYFSAPILEDFNDAPWIAGSPGDISPCWSRDLGSYPWEVGNGTTPSFGSGPNGDYPGHGGGNYMFTEASSAGFGDTSELTTPWIDLTPLNTPQLRFFYHFNLRGDFERFSVSVDNGNGWTEIDTIEQETHNDESDPWFERIVDLSTYAGDSVQVKFTVVYGGTYADYSIDNFEIRERPSCPKPSDLTINALTSDSAFLEWTSNASGSEWQVEYGAPGFTQGNGTTAILNSNPDTLGGLTPQTDYEFYIREICGAGDTSAWTLQPVPYSTPCAADTVPFLEEFDNAPWVSGSPGTIDNCWRREQGDFPWEVGTGTTPSTNCGPDGDYPGHGPDNYMFTEGSGSSGEGILYTPLIDLSNFNVPELRFFYHFYLNDSDVGEFHVEINNGSGWVTLDSKFVQTHSDQTDPWSEWRLPLHGYENETVQIRFRAVSGGTRSDYAIDHVQVRELAPNDVGVTDLLEPVEAGCGEAYSPDVPITIEVKNFGAGVQDTIPVGYTVNGGTPVLDTLFQTVQPGDVDTISFTPTGALSTQGDYDLELFTHHPQDTLPGNDLLNRTITNGGNTLTPSFAGQEAINDGDFTYENSLFICDADYDIYDCGRILSLTIDSLTHEDALDELDIQLVSPEGTTLDLWMQLGAFNDEAMSNLVFTDTIDQNITTSTGDPHTGIYRPQEAAGFAKFNGEQLNGEWTLRIFNDDCCDTAAIHGWNMRAIDPPMPQPDLGPDTTICKEENLLLDPGEDPAWSYLWDNNSTDRTRTVVGEFLDTTEHSYHVTVTNENPLNQCSNSDTIKVNVEDCTSLEDRNGGSEIAFEVHPNPTSDKLFIESDASGERFRYEMMDMQGRVLESKLSEADQRSTIDVSSYSKGVYILKGYRESNDEVLFQHKVVVD